MSRKSERLVNLTIALLATKRWLTKSQIFSSVDGYEGEPESMERMFERDKDDLRNLGITIEVGSFDPLFDDEVGYRIRPESYRATVPTLTSRQISLISLATQAWQGAVLDSAALSGLVKLKSMGIDSDMDSIPTFAPRVHNSDENFRAIVDAIASRRAISFSYQDENYETHVRVIEPYGVGTKSGFWYVAGFDLDRKAERLFRLDRMDSEVSLQGKAHSYEIPAHFVMRNFLESPERDRMAIIKVRQGKGHLLRIKADSVTEDGDWSILTIPFHSDSELLTEVLWHGADAVVLAPEEFRQSAFAKLQEIVRLHG